MTAPILHDPDSDEAVTASALRSLTIARSALDRTIDDVANGALGTQLRAAVNLIRECGGRLIVTGIGKSGHVARKLAATLSSTGTPAYFVHPTEASHGDLGMIGREDVLLALSWSGETAELAALITYAKRFSLPIIAMTCDPQSALGRAAAVTIILPKVREACPHGLTPTTSTLVQLALGDALAIALLEARGFSALDFKVFHPGGRLGANLRFVRDVMHSKDRLPLLPIGSPMTDAIMAMTSHGFGVVGIVDPDDRLVGIITDGDLRRNMSREVFDRIVDTVMSPRPKVVDPGMIAMEALEIMQNRKISVLFVVEGEHPVGIIHTLDLLRAGLA